MNQPGHEPKKKLIILTTHFGEGFSGGSDATVEVFSRIQENFDQIIVVGNQLGNHTIQNLEFLAYKNWIHAFLIIRKHAKENPLYYGDFYNSIIYWLAGVQYYFTYHDNWPEQGALGGWERIRSVWFTILYVLILKGAKVAFTVSAFKYSFVQKHSGSAKLIPNGFSSKICETIDYSRSTSKILMIGNIDKRKYALADKVFNEIDSSKDLSIEIFGRIIDKTLARKLSKYPFVTLKGYSRDIPIANYRLLLHTSVSESFGMIFCEAAHNRIPVLTFNAGGARELIPPTNGVLIEKYDVKKMARSLLDFPGLEVDPAAVEQYSWENTSRKYLEHLV